MEKLHLGIEMRDFDLERLGVSFSVLDTPSKRAVSEGYLRMTLGELNTFLRALKAADQTVEVSAVDLGSAKPSRAAMLLSRTEAG
jgi:hypothetical protein